MRQKVLRTVRLLPQAVKIGIPGMVLEPLPEPEPEVKPEPKVIKAKEVEPEAEAKLEPEEKPAPVASEAVAEANADALEQASGLESTQAESLLKLRESARAKLEQENKERERREQAERELIKLREDLAAAQNDINKFKSLADDGVKVKGELEAKLAEVSAAKNKLDGEIDGIKLDYENRKREIEANAAAEAKKAADEARALGHKAGFDAGHSEGVKAARVEIAKEYRDKFEKLTQTLAKAHEAVDKNLADLVELNKPRMLRLWAEMLSKMLRRQVELNPDTASEILADLLNNLSDKSSLLVYVSPEDLANIEAAADGAGELQEALRGVKNIEFKADANVDKGSVIAETSLGVYDARWRTQFEQINIILDKIFKSAAK